MKWTSWGFSNFNLIKSSFIGLRCHWESHWIGTRVTHIKKLRWNSWIFCNEFKSVFEGCKHFEIIKNEWQRGQKSGHFITQAKFYDFLASKTCFSQCNDYSNQHLSLLNENSSFINYHSMWFSYHKEVQRWLFEKQVASRS